MKVTLTHRGFEWIDHPTRGNEPGIDRLVSQSSAVGDYDDALDRPGTSFLWIGADHHLNRNQVRELIAHLTAWVDTGSLAIQASERTQAAAILEAEHLLQETFEKLEPNDDRDGWFAVRITKIREALSGYRRVQEEHL
jgi:hypothetical protein